MRVGIDASNLRGGGGVTHLVELLRAACPADQGIRQVVVWGGKATFGALPDKAWLHPVHDSLLDRSLPWRLAWQFSRLPTLAERACDVLFTPGATPQHTRMPCVTMSQNLLPFEPVERRRFGYSKMGAKMRLLELSQRRAFRQANGVIFLTRYAQKIVQQRIGGLQAKQTIIPHGIATEFRLPPRTVRPIASYSLAHPFRLVYVSIIDVYKHQWHVAEAIAQVRRAGFPVTLDFVGPAYGPALKRLQEVIRHVDSKQEFIHYVGPVDYRQLPAWYHGADAFVYASSCENLPIILLEAMAAGLPIACSHHGPMPEVLGQAGVYFDPENASDIATTILSLLTDDEFRQQCAQQAFEQSQSYTWEECAKKTFEFIVDIANCSTSTR